MRISILYVIWIVYSANCCVIIHLNCILNVNLNHLGLKNLALSQSLQRLIYLLFSVLSCYCFHFDDTVPINGVTFTLTNYTTLPVIHFKVRTLNGTLLKSRLVGCWYTNIKLKCGIIFNYLMKGNKKLQRQSKSIMRFYL